MEWLICIWEQKGVGCEGCYPYGAYSTCAVYLDFLLVRSGTTSSQQTTEDSLTVLIPGHPGGTALEFAHNQWTWEQISNWK